MKRLIPVVAALVMVLIFGTFVPEVLARVLNPEYRTCMQQAVSKYQSAIIANQRAYNDALISAMEHKKQGYVDSWNNEDESAQQAGVREADKQWSREYTDARKQKSDADRVANNDYSNDRKPCAPLKNPKTAPTPPSPPPPPPPAPTNPGMCPEGYRSVCRSPCADPNQICIMICVHGCERI